MPGLLRILRVRLALRLSSWIPLPKGEGSSFFVEMFLTHNDKRLARGITPKFTLTPNSPRRPAAGSNPRVLRALPRLLPALLEPRHERLAAQMFGALPVGRDCPTDGKDKRERGLADLNPWAPLRVAVTP